MPAKLPAITLSLTFAIGLVLSACGQQEYRTEKPEESATVKPQVVLATWLEEPGWTTIGANPQGTRAQIKPPKRISSGQPIFRTEFRYLDQSNLISGVREDNCLKETTEFYQVEDKQGSIPDDFSMRAKGGKPNYSDMVFAYVCQTSTGKMTPGSDIKQVIQHLKSLGYRFSSAGSSQALSNQEKLTPENLLKCRAEYSGCEVLFEKPSLDFSLQIETDGRNLISVSKRYKFLESCKKAASNLYDDCKSLRDYFSYRDQNLDTVWLESQSKLNSLTACYIIALESEEENNKCSSITEYRFRDGFLYLYQTSGKLDVKYSWLPNNPKSVLRFKENSIPNGYYAPLYPREYVYHSFKDGIYSEGYRITINKPISSRFEPIKKNIVLDKKTGKLYCNVDELKLPNGQSVRSQNFRYIPRAINPENGYRCTASGWKYEDYIPQDEI
ncbi:hypothetical protein [Synechococcus elongatus]|uniref:Lipoprotein n=1 Tax=Synechococcus elongatus PCC 11802 TaxID=2283154 RepID=A0AAT9JUZ0_SYNEL|nr:hypothetical protein [Synechococcus elongatus]QFZ92706.1 hypothetical protein EKO22_10510 [Synechococcus elongatus PCC 11802]